MEAQAASPSLCLGHVLERFLTPFLRPNVARVLLFPISGFVNQEPERPGALGTPVPNFLRPPLPSEYPTGPRLGSVASFFPYTLICSMQGQASEGQ